MGIFAAGFYKPNVIPDVPPAVSKHIMEFKVLMPTTENHTLVLLFPDQTHC